MKLVSPSMLYESQILAFRKEMMEAGDSFDGCAGLELTESVSQWLNFEERLKQLYGDGYVPSDVFLWTAMSARKRAWISTPESLLMRGSYSQSLIS